MKTISGRTISTEPISLSKAAKILSKFVSAENGASQVISAYLHRASTSFNELNQLHKELKSSRSHKKDKRHKTENNDPDDEKSTQTVKFSQEPNGSIGYHAGNVGGSEMHKKNKKKQQAAESVDNRDLRVEFGGREREGKLPTRAQYEIESGREFVVEGDSNMGIEEGKKHKREKKKKKDKGGNFKFSSNKSEVKIPNGESPMGSEHQKEIEKKLRNSMEGENGYQDLQTKKIKKYEAGSENKLYGEEVKVVEKRKRKNEDEEGRVEDRSGNLTKKKVKRNCEGDH